MKWRILQIINIDNYTCLWAFFTDDVYRSTFIFCQVSFLWNFNVFSQDLDQDGKLDSNIAIFMFGILNCHKKNDYRTENVLVSDTDV